MSIAGRRNIPALGAAIGVAVLGCFAAGALTARSSMLGVLVIGALGCLVMYLTKPQLLTWVALFLAFASLPAGLHVAKLIGPVTIWAYQVALGLAICSLILVVRPRFTTFVVPAGFLFTVAFFTAMGVASGNAPDRVAREALFLCEMVAGFVLACLIVRAGYVKECIRTMAVILWFSMAMLAASEFAGVKLAGRIESLEAEVGSADAVRMLTSSQMPAVAVLAVLVAAQIVGRAKLSMWLVLGLPAAVISLLSFSRNLLIILAVTAAVAFVTSLGWAAIRRTAVFATVGAFTLAVVIPSGLFLIHDTGLGGWLGDQLNAFSHRVLGGLSSNSLKVDPSTLARLRENANLESSFADAPTFGHGLGYAYQFAFGTPEAHQSARDTFSLNLGTTYAHNFYLWWLVKSGVVGMVAFAVFALTPFARAIQNPSAPVRISAAVSAGLLAVCAVVPLPLDGANSLVLGMALGATATFANLRSDTGKQAYAIDETKVPSELIGVS